MINKIYGRPFTCQPNEWNFEWALEVDYGDEANTILLTRKQALKIASQIIQNFAADPQPHAKVNNSKGT